MEYTNNSQLYLKKLEEVKSLKCLFELRIYFQSEIDLNSSMWKETGSNPFSKFLTQSQNANFYLKRVENQICFLEKEMNMFLNNHIK
jgi:hypothetical protein